MQLLCTGFACYSLVFVFKNPWFCKFAAGSFQVSYMGIIRLFIFFSKTSQCIMTFVWTENGIKTDGAWRTHEKISLSALILPSLRAKKAENFEKRYWYIPFTNCISWISTACYCLIWHKFCFLWSVYSLCFGWYGNSYDKFIVKWKSPSGLAGVVKLSEAHQLRL